MERPTRLLQNFLRVAKSSSVIIPLSLLPLLCVMWVAHGKIQTIQLLEQQVAGLEKKAVFQKKQKEKRDLIWGHAQKSDPHYLEKTFDLLVPELKRVQALCRQYPDNRALHERLNFLQGEGNRIRWTLFSEREELTFHEKEFKMETRVQMNDDDLRKFLVAVEGDDYSPAEGKPFLIVKEFDLSRERQSSDEFVYTIQAEVIQRS